MKKGSTHTPEIRAQISASLLQRGIDRTGQGAGRRLSEEHKAKISAARLANNGMRGRHHSEETRAKMRAATNPGWATGEDAVSWKGGRPFDKHGYVLIYRPDHPAAVGNYVREHRLVAEEMLGRPLQATEHVHHRNERKNDNRPENLQVLSKGAHMRLHRLLEMADGRGSPKSRQKAHVPTQTQ